MGYELNGSIIIIIIPFIVGYFFVVQENYLQ